MPLNLNLRHTRYILKHCIYSQWFVRKDALIEFILGN